MLKIAITLSCVLSLFAGEATSPAFAASLPQGSAQDYQRAEELPGRFRHLVYGHDVEETWLEDGQLVYSKSTALGQTEFFLVNPKAAGWIEPKILFNADKLAEVLGVRAAGQQVIRVEQQDSNTLLLLLTEAKSCLKFTLKGQELSEVSLDAITPFDLPAFQTDHPSGRGRAGGGSGILFRNQLDQEVELFWLESSTKKRSYGKVAAGASKWMSTYSGHAWRVTTADGKTVASFRAEAKEGVARIGTAAEMNLIKPERPDRETRIASKTKTKRAKIYVDDHNLWMRAPDGGEPTALTTNGTAENSYRNNTTWAPDGSAFVGLQTEGAQDHTVSFVESSPQDQLQPTLHQFQYLKPGDDIAHPRPRLFLKNKKGGFDQVEIDEPLFANPWSLTRLSWSADSRKFRFLYNQRGHQVLRWVEVDAKTGKARALIEESSPTFVDYAGKTYLHVVEDRGEAIWMSERSGWNHLYVVDLESGKVKRALTEGEWVVRKVEDFNQDRDELLLQVMGIHPAQDPYHLHWAVVNLKSGKLTKLTEGDGTHQLTWSPDGEYFLDRYSRVDMPTVTELRRRDGRLVAELGSGRIDKLVEAGWIPPQRFVAKGRDGKTEIWGLIYRPTNFDSNKSYPVIENIYAGPHSAFVPKNFRVFRKSQALAELGFMVVHIDGMGTNWRSKAFHDVAWKNLGDAGFPDRIAWMRALAATEPAMDLSRVGIYGGSAGGQSAMRALIAHHDFYSAAVADCGCHDNRMDKIWWNELWMGWPVDDSYAQASNVDQAHRMQGDLMLVVGEVDRNVDPASTMQVVNALIKADKDFDLLVVPGGGHGIAESPYGTRRRRDFFVRKLLHVEPRWK
ncbi:MAG: prolyl oligopeptidase family serine peptidase [Planctomycetes bacterium]|nr:prolyl oligopeptidase family serine peptidase [Planctomycetota bacterium]